MAFEINEIGIRMRIVGDGEAAQSSGGSGSGEGGGSGEDRRREIVEACVRRVLQILRASEAR